MHGIQETGMWNTAAVLEHIIFTYKCVTANVQTCSQCADTKWCKQLHTRHFYCPHRFQGQGFAQRHQPRGAGWKWPNARSPPPPRLYITPATRTSLQRVVAAVLWLSYNWVLRWRHCTGQSWPSTLLDQSSANWITPLSSSELPSRKERTLHYTQKTELRHRSMCVGRK